MIKFRLYFDKDAETIWLNELAAKGWAMIFPGICLCFFNRCHTILSFQSYQ